MARTSRLPRHPQRVPHVRECVADSQDPLGIRALARARRVRPDSRRRAPVGEAAGTTRPAGDLDRAGRGTLPRCDRPGLYGRDFNLYWDSQHLGNVTAMLARAAPWWLIATVAGVSVLVMVLAYVLARLAFGGGGGGAWSARDPGSWLGAVAGAAIIVFAGQQLLAPASCLLSRMPLR